jgi:hypothetical protein
MGKANFWEDGDSSQHKRPEKPFWTLPLDKKEAEPQVLEWLNGELAYLNEFNRPRFLEIQRNHEWHRGFQAQLREQANEEDATKQKKSYLGKIEPNDTFDLVEARVARLIKYKPAVSIMPANDEHSDKVGAKACKNLVDYIWYKERFDDEQILELVTNAMTEGEAFIFPLWNPDKGDLDQEYVDKYKAKVDAGEKVPLLGENGEPELDDDGKPIMIESEIRNGDVEHVIESTLNVRVQRKRSNRYKDADHVMRLEEMPVEEARLKWPNAAAKIRAIEEANEWEVFDPEEGPRKVEKNSVLVVHMYHKRTKTLPRGRYVVFTREAILHNDKLPYSCEGLPCERLTDDDYKDVLHGKSFISRVRPLVRVKGKLTNMIVRNIFMLSHPKWMMPAGAAKLEALGNDSTIVQYKGPTAPALVSSQATPAEVYNFRSILGDETYRKAGIGETSRGEPPAGIKAFVALQFVSEMEQELFNRLILKLNAFIKNVTKKDLAVAGDYYAKDEKRAILIQGKEGRWMSAFFDSSHLSKPYDVRAQNSSALPQSKGARIQTVMDLNKEFPGLIPQEQLVELIDLGQSDKFVTAVTVSIRAAEAENEFLMEGKDVKAPEQFEDQVIHWKIHSKMIQEWGFKHQTPKEIQDKAIDHMRATEMLLWDRSVKFPKFATILETLPGFPLVYEPHPQTPPTPEAPMDPLPPELPPEGAPPVDPAMLDQLEAGEPVNPDQGGAPQDPTIPAGVPSLETQIQGGEELAPTSGI